MAGVPTGPSQGAEPLQQADEPAGSLTSDEVMEDNDDTTAEAGEAADAADLWPQRTLQFRHVTLILLFLEPWCQRAGLIHAAFCLLTILLLLSAYAFADFLCLKVDVSSSPSRSEARSIIAAGSFEANQQHSILSHSPGWTVQWINRSCSNCCMRSDYHQAILNASDMSTYPFSFHQY